MPNLFQYLLLIKAAFKQIRTYSNRAKLEGDAETSSA